MRSMLIVLAATLLLAGCFTNDGDETTAPTTPGVGNQTGPVPGAPDSPLGGSSTGCTAEGEVGAGNGDITSDRACPGELNESANGSV